MTQLKEEVHAEWTLREADLNQKGEEMGPGVKEACFASPRVVYVLLSILVAKVKSKGARREKEPQEQ